MDLKTQTNICVGVIYNVLNNIQLSILTNNCLVLSSCVDAVYALLCCSCKIFDYYFSSKNSIYVYIFNSEQITKTA